MRQTILTTLLTALLSPGATWAATSCSDIAAATVAELQAGAAEWNDNIESLVRSAAGSACVKAQSGTFTSEAAEEKAADEKAEAVVIREEQVAAAASMSAEETSAEEMTAEEKEEDDGKAGWKFLGFEVNSVTGSPAQKPYERKR